MRSIPSIVSDISVHHRDAPICIYGAAEPAVSHFAAQVAIHSVNCDAIVMNIPSVVPDVSVYVVLLAPGVGRRRAGTHGEQSCGNSGNGYGSARYSCDTCVHFRILLNSGATFQMHRRSRYTALDAA